MSDIIWVDEDDGVLGEVSRDKAHAEGLLHRVAITYLINEKGEILVKEGKDGVLDHSSSGHVNVGENYLEAATRSLIEELRVHDITLIEIGEGKSEIKGVSDDAVPYGCRHIFKIFVGKPLSILPNLEEIKGLYWADPHFIFSDMKQHADKYEQCFKATLQIYINSVDISTQS